MEILIWRFAGTKKSGRNDEVVAWQSFTLFQWLTQLGAIFKDYVIVSIPIRESNFPLLSFADNMLNISLIPMEPGRTVVEFFKVYYCYNGSCKPRVRV